MKRILAFVVVSLALSLAALAQAPAKSAGEAPSKPKASAASAAMPRADEILNRYADAVGGRASWRKLTSRQSIGTIDVPGMNLSGTVEIHEKAPDKMLSVVTISGAVFRQGFDGTVAWADDPQNGMREETGAELAETRRDADFYLPIDLRSLYAKFAVTGKEKIGERDVYILDASSAQGDPDKMYFDLQTGLLVRDVSLHHTPEGVGKYQDDLSDYREVDGIKLPFTIHQTSADSEFTIQWTEVRHNIPLDDSQFSKPAAQ
jgi:zinc protease